MAKKLVESDYKNHRVEDPTRISSRQENHVKKYVKDFFDKVVAQKRAHDKKKVERRAEREQNEGKPAESPTLATAKDEKKGDVSDGEPGMDLSDDEGGEKYKQESATPITPVDPLVNGDGGLKRKRDTENGSNNLDMVGEDATPTKRQKSETPPPPPPPPPPPASSILPGQSELSEQVTMDSAMDVDDADVPNTLNLANGCGSIYDQVSTEGFPMFHGGSAPLPPLVDQVQMEALDSTANNARDHSADSPDTDPLTPGLGLESERDGGFTSKLFQGVQGLQVHHGS